mmetsp:Transcript_52472/g.170438  ORF Transcript_52472/g.170438 Transcript_52472/m.170438 type:complete len:201 (+) Transcript_52472:1712-2314(+)
MQERCGAAREALDLHLRVPGWRQREFQAPHRGCDLGEESAGTSHPAHRLQRHGLLLHRLVRSPGPGWGSAAHRGHRFVRRWHPQHLVPPEVPVAVPHAVVLPQNSDISLERSQGRPDPSERLAERHQQYEPRQSRHRFRVYLYRPIPHRLHGRQLHPCLQGDSHGLGGGCSWCSRGRSLRLSSAQSQEALDWRPCQLVTP